jgi:uncharacterized protein (DUF2252 family)
MSQPTAPNDTAGILMKGLAPSPDQRHIQGLAERDRVPWSSIASTVAPGTRDAFAILDAQNANREAELIPLRWERMGVDPFTFYRGSAAVMANDLAAMPRTSLHVQLCGDAHLTNFGLFATAERRLVFDLNDFDETHPGPFEWDLLRLATSGAVAAAALGLDPKDGIRAARGAASAYRRGMRQLASLAPMDAWYARLDVDDLAGRLSKGPLAEAFGQAVRDSRKRTQSQAVRRFTEQGPDGLRLRNEPPVQVRVDGDQLEALRPAVDALMHDYLSTLGADRHALLRRYRFAGLGHKVVGVGSVGTRSILVLAVADGQQGLILQLKQAGPSVLETALKAPRYGHDGRRVVIGQRVLQAAGDPLLGWATGPTDGREYYVRQLRDMKASVDVSALDAKGLVAYLRLCGVALARAHARSADATAIAAYMGHGKEFPRAVGAFAASYLEVVRSDFEAFSARVRAGA